MRLRLAILSLVTSALVLTPRALPAQEWRGGEARAEGTVKNEKGEPIAGAKVSLRWGKSGRGGPDLTTNKKGKWAIFGLAGGPWDVDFQAAGYLSKKISVELSEMQRIPPIEVQLQPEPKPEPQSHEEVRVGGQTISKEDAATIERGNAALEAKNYAEAREAYMKAYTNMSDSVPLLLGISAAYYGEGNTDEGLKYARLVTEKDPQNVSGWRMVAEMELQNGNLEAGKAALEKVPEEKITDAQPYFNIGVLLLNKKKPAEAEPAFTKAIAVQPDFAQAYYFRGLARIQLKRKAEARADLQKNLELAPDGPDAKDVKELLNSIR